MKKGPNTPKSSTESHKKKCKVFSSLFHIKWDLMLVSRLSVGRIIPFSQVLSIGAIWRNWAQITQIMTRNMWKVMQSVQLHIFHQVSFYSSVRALCGLSYNCFSGTRDNLGKLGPNTPNHVQGHMKSNTKSSNVYFTSNETLF